MSHLVVTAGLPGSGKSTVAAALGRATGWPVLSVDVVDDAVRRAGVAEDQPTGLAAYVAVEALAEANLRGGADGVVVDAVNDAPAAREQWETLAERVGARLLVVTVSCEEPLLRERLSTRRRGFARLPEPTWESVARRRAAWVGWDVPLRVEVRGAGPVEDAVAAVRAHLP